MVASALVLRRITFDPGSKRAELAPIPWPAGQAPSPQTTSTSDTDPLPGADVLLVTYTVAEARALADVLTPGVQSTSWHHYTRDFASYESLLTSRSPAKDSKRLGSWYLTQIGDKKVICFKSELHPSTDGARLPMVKLWSQLVADASPKLVVTTGTAGGVGTGTELGDVAIASSVQWDCQEQYKAEPWAKASYPMSPLTPAMKTSLAGIAPLLAANASKIPSQYLSRPIKIWEAETTITTDFFAIGDTTDHYGLLALAPTCRAVEMDDAALGMAFSGQAGAAPMLSIRNASDPVMPGTEPIDQQVKEASSIYETYGYFTTVSSAIACWAVTTAL